MRVSMVEAVIRSVSTSLFPAFLFLQFVSFSFLSVLKEHVTVTHSCIRVVSAGKYIGSPSIPFGILAWVKVTLLSWQSLSVLLWHNLMWLRRDHCKFNSYLSMNSSFQEGKLILHRFLNLCKFSAVYSELSCQV